MPGFVALENNQSNLKGSAMGIHNVTRKSSSTFIAGIWLAAILPLLTACGGGGGGGSAPVDSTVSGQTGSTVPVSAGTTTPTAPSTSSLSVTEISSGPAFRLDVDINKFGTAAAVWMDDNLGRGRIWSNRFENGRWGTPVQISTSNETTTPRVAINSQGDAVAVWEDRHYVSTLSNGTDVTVWVSRYQGGAWTAPTQVSAWVTHGEAAPVVDIDDAGHAIVAWLQEEQGSIRPSAWQASYDGSAWSQPKRLSDGIHKVWQLQLEMNAAGDGVAAWVQETNNFDEPGYSDGSSSGYTVPNMWAANYVGGGWSAASRIGDPALVKLDMCTDVDLAMNERGSAVATCWQRKGVVESIAMSTFEPGQPGSWSSVPSVVTALADTEYAGAHTVALANDGGILVGLEVTQKSSFLDKILSVHRYDAASASWAQPLQLSCDVYSRRPLIKFDGAGTGYVIWDEAETFAEWQMHRFSPSTGWDVKQPLPVPFLSDDIHFAVAGNGYGVMVFEKSKPTVDGYEDYAAAVTWP